jgi:hypothetical protein
VRPIASDEDVVRARQKVRPLAVMPLIRPASDRAEIGGDCYEHRRYGLRRT